MEQHIINIEDIEYTIYKDENVWGDGQHESTRFILNLIYKYGVKDKSVMDVGTGTGILSVLCGKLKAASILAIDCDYKAIEWARKNFKRNDVHVDIEINNLTQYIDDKVDVIVSNLPGIIQVENMRHIANNLNDNGLLIISWWKTLNFETYVQGFNVIEHIQGVDYDAYVLTKNKKGELHGKN